MSRDLPGGGICSTLVHWRPPIDVPANFRCRASTSVRLTVARMCFLCCFFESETSVYVVHFAPQARTWAGEFFSSFLFF